MLSNTLIHQMLAIVLARQHRGHYNHGPGFKIRTLNTIFTSSYSRTTISLWHLKQSNTFRNLNLMLLKFIIQKHELRHLWNIRWEHQSNAPWFSCPSVYAKTFHRHFYRTFVCCIALLMCRNRRATTNMMQQSRLTWFLSFSVGTIWQIVLGWVKNPKGKGQMFSYALYSETLQIWYLWTSYTRWVAEATAQKHPDYHTGSCSRMCICAH